MQALAPLSRSHEMRFRRIASINQRLCLFTPKIKEFCFVLGAMKCGTTTLFAYLAQHSEICENLYMKEPEYFSKDSVPADLDEYYRQFFPLPFRRQVALEASTGYTKMPGFPNVAARLQFLP